MKDTGHGGGGSAASKVEKSSKPEKGTKLEKVAKPEKGTKFEKPARVEKPGKPDKGTKWEKPEAAREKEREKDKDKARAPEGKKAPARKLDPGAANQAAYFNRELSWLAFNRRVLEQAENKAYPLLERLRYLSFVSSNLDEFFEIRVAGLIQQVESGVIDSGSDGLGPKEQLHRIHEITAAMVADQYRCWQRQLVPALQAEEIEFKNKEQLSKREFRWVKKYFEDQVYPVLTPLAIDPSHPFPQIGNKTLNILAWLEDPSAEKGSDEALKMAVIPVPRILPRVVQIAGPAKIKPSYIFLSDILKFFAATLFPGYRIRAVHAFRITRNSDLYIDEEEIENLLQTIEEELAKLRRGAAVRLEIEDGVEEELLGHLLEAIKLAPEYVFRITGPLNLKQLMSVYDLIDRPDLKFRPQVPYAPPSLGRGDLIFEAIAREDILLHHPYDSFTPVVDFIQQAAHDPEVLAIKLTLYRTSSDSPIVQALIDASHNGKQVAALIELKARFDEAQNIQWARRLEEAGVHVVYGIAGHKTHCKCCLVVRREAGGLRRYAHLGTGNYHPKTARLYTDISLFTAEEELTEEVAAVFNNLTGFARRLEFKKLLVAPYSLHASMRRLIQHEAKAAKKGRRARIVVKCNSLVDKETIDNLYFASRAGVQVQLIIRGICCLVPGIKGVSENIKVTSLLGRYLEHSRIFYFENAGGDPKVFVGSADWMPRNFFRRVEVVFPVENPALRDRVIATLETNLKDTNGAVLRPNGGYARPRRAETAPFSSQEHFLAEAEALRRRDEHSTEGA